MTASKQPAPATVRTDHLVDLIARLPRVERHAWIASRSEDELTSLLYGWEGVRARPEQLPPPGDWSTWLYMAGRGSGKTRSMAEWFHGRAMGGSCKFGAIVAPTPADARDFCVEGPSGLLHVGLPGDRPVYQASTRSIEWRTGFRALVYSAEDPDQIRGPNVDTAWATEMGAWPVAIKKTLNSTSKAQDAWNNLMFTLRVGDDPRCVIDTTPRPMEPLKSILKERGTVVTRGTTFDNRANLSAKFLAYLDKYKGTRIGRQEIGGELLEDVEGALWSIGLLDRQRLGEGPADYDRIVIGVDPPGSTAECGIVVAGRCAATRTCYVLDDRSTEGTPAEWGQAVVQAFDDWGADLVVAETNFGGQMVLAVLQNSRKHLPCKEIHSSRGKALRAEPISTLYETGEIHHVGVFPLLEEQLCSWTQGMQSPDRLDAMVFALTELHSVVADWLPGHGAVIGVPLAGSKPDW